MTIQDKYIRVIEMLESEILYNPIISKCLSTVDKESTFTFFSDEIKVSKRHLLNFYTTNAEFEQTFRPESPFVVGYSELLPKLKLTELEYINICDICSELGSFLIFMDYEYKEFIGILHTKRTLSEVRQKMVGSEYYSENVFINRELINKHIQ